MPISSRPYSVGAFTSWRGGSIRHWRQQLQTSRPRRPAQMSRSVLISTCRRAVKKSPILPVPAAAPALSMKFIAMASRAIVPCLFLAPAPVPADDVDESLPSHYFQLLVIAPPSCRGMHLRRNFSSSKLVRLLGDLGNPGHASVGASRTIDASSQDFAEKLSLWVGVFESVTLHAAHRSISAVADDKPSRLPSRGALPLDEQLHQVRTILERAINTGH